MTDQEFDVLDELYFLTSFQDIVESCDISSEKLPPILWQMISRGWVNCFKNYDQEFEPGKEEFTRNFADYHYLASKKGLMMHNAR